MSHQLEYLFPHGVEIDVKNCQGSVKIEDDRLDVLKWRRIHDLLMTIPNRMG
jgi:hypothetical protein